MQVLPHGTWNNASYPGHGGVQVDQHELGPRLLALILLYKSAFPGVVVLELFILDRTFRKFPDPSLDPDSICSNKFLKLKKNSDNAKLPFCVIA